MDAGFQVTALTRGGSSHSFPPSVKAVTVDYDSLDSLTSALKGHDAVVSTIASVALVKQLNLVAAASKAGIKRFIPSEFGSDTFHERTRQLPCYADKIAVQDALKHEAASGRMSWTAVVTGPFFDWGMKVGFVMNLKGKSITLYDGGERPFSTTTLASIGKATAGVLKHSKETENRAVYVQDFVPTLQQLAAMGKRAMGPDGWKEDYVSVDEMLNEAWAELKKDQPDPSKFVMHFIKATIVGEGFGGQFQKLDNDLLGVSGMREEEVQELINRLAK